MLTVGVYVAKAQPNSPRLAHSNKLHNRMLSKEADKSTNPKSFGENASMLNLGRLITSVCVSNLLSHEASQLLEMESDLKLMINWKTGFQKPPLFKQSAWGR